tara:strand:+ start:106 stop:348 length:243 start_codon:yes stop_codon:yes gene_type:complete
MNEDDYRDGHIDGYDEGYVEGLSEGEETGFRLGEEQVKSYIINILARYKKEPSGWSTEDMARVLEEVLDVDEEADELDKS